MNINLWLAPALLPLPDDTPGQGTETVVVTKVCYFILRLSIVHIVETIGVYGYRREPGNVRPDHDRVY